jgi:hypothetical protein
MPGEGKQPLGLDLLNRRLPNQMFIARLRHTRAHHLSGDKWPFELGAKPRSEFLVIGQGAPDARHRGVELNALLDAISHSEYLTHVRVPDSEATLWLPIQIASIELKRNRFVAFRRSGLLRPDH